jgi:hypothetical protein
LKTDRLIEGTSKEREMAFTGVKVFSATKAREREELGENVTRWLRANTNVRIVDKVVTQSSDREFHCLTITLFYDKDGE